MFISKPIIIAMVLGISGPGAAARGEARFA